MPAGRHAFLEDLGNESVEGLIQELAGLNPSCTLSVISCETGYIWQYTAGELAGASRTAN